MKYLEQFMDQEQIVQYEGRRGTTNLCKVVRAIGYNDPQQFGQLDRGAFIGDLIEFLDDNSGAIEALVNWIDKQRSTEWDDALKAQLIDEPEED
jgi:LPS sulfotransferase NodH